MSTIVSMPAVTNAVSWNIGRNCLTVENFDECCCLPVKRALVIFWLLLRVLVAVITTPRHIVHTYLVMTIFTFTLSTAVHGYHAYQYNWKPDIRDELYCKKELRNSNDNSAVAVKNDTIMVVHVLRLLSMIFFSVYQERGLSYYYILTAGGILLRVRWKYHTF